MRFATERRWHDCATSGFVVARETLEGVLRKLSHQL